MIVVQILLGISSLLTSPGIIPHRWVAFDWLAQFHQLGGALIPAYNDRDVVPCGTCKILCNRMMRVVKAIYWFFPVQLLLLHLKKFQVLLIFWFILFSTLNGGFMRAYGAAALFLSPEYLGDVSPASAAIVGLATGIFIMSWNITTFILFSRHFRFLATTSKPFLKYCINNAILPAIFLVFYFVKVLQFNINRELLSVSSILWLCVGFLFGFILLISASLYYFFRADKTIIRRMTPVISNPKLFKSQFSKEEVKLNESRLMRVKWYLNSPTSIRKTRDVAHYSKAFIESIFNRHQLPPSCRSFWPLSF